MFCLLVCCDVYLRWKLRIENLKKNVKLKILQINNQAWYKKINYVGGLKLSAV